MKKLTLNQINLEIIDSRIHLSYCDFCNESNKLLVLSSFPFQYKNEDKKDRTYKACICFDCVKQLDVLLKDSIC